jgi:hypothetical protein
MPVHLTCPACDKAFSRKPADIARGRGKFCSHRCHSEAQRQPRPIPEISEDGLTALIPLYARDDSVRGYTLVDVADAEWVCQWRWYLRRDGYVARSERSDEGKTLVFRLHRELFGLTARDKTAVDHINRVKTDHRRSNLRVIPRWKNAQNQPNSAGSTSRYRGVSWYKTTGKWVASVRTGGTNGKLTHLGYFTDEHEAGRVAQEARARLLPYSVD